jgi:hypothetical protein
MTYTVDSFTDWLHGQLDRRGPIGDLARDVAEDETWPKVGRLELADYRDYLYDVGAIEEAVDALGQAWVEYDGVALPSDWKER